MFSGSVKILVNEKQRLKIGNREISCVEFLLQIRRKIKEAVEKIKHLFEDESGSKDIKC